MVPPLVGMGSFLRLPNRIKLVSADFLSSLRMLTGSFPGIRKRLGPIGMVCNNQDEELVLLDIVIVTPLGAVSVRPACVKSVEEIKLRGSCVASISLSKCPRFHLCELICDLGLPFEHLNPSPSLDLPSIRWKAGPVEPAL
jgi:hypothetical protein